MAVILHCNLHSSDNFKKKKKKKKIAMDPPYCNMNFGFINIKSVFWSFEIQSTTESAAFEFQL